LAGFIAEFQKGKSAVESSPFEDNFSSKNLRGHQELILRLIAKLTNIDLENAGIFP